MSQNRRDFIKFVIAGSVAAGCPVDHNLLAAPAAQGPQKLVEGEHNEICHKVRDGFHFQIPAVSPPRITCNTMIGCCWRRSRTGAAMPMEWILTAPLTLPARHSCSTRTTKRRNWQKSWDW